MHRGLETKNDNNRVGVYKSIKLTCNSCILSLNVVTKTKKNKKKPKNHGCLETKL